VDVEKHNLAQIELLNQRGGRALSIVDLIKDGSITAEMAAFCWLTLQAGERFLTGAVPGGVGKTTLMAALLSFLPPEERIVTVSDRRVIDNAISRPVEPPVTYLAHEIGSGAWFAYIWGRDARDFFRLSAGGARCVSCIHADTPLQSWEALSGLGVGEEDFRRISLQLYMVADRTGRGVRRRVRSLCHFTGGAHRPIYEWDGADDRFHRLLGRDELCKLAAEKLGATPQMADRLWRTRQGELQRWQGEGVSHIEDVRRRVLRSYAS